MKLWALLPVMLLVAACSPKNSGPVPVAQEDRIINGKSVDRDSTVANATVALMLADGDRIRTVCTGTLVSKDLVVTAGHCVEPIYSGYEMVVSFGPETYTSKNEGDLREIDRAISYDYLTPPVGESHTRSINELRDVALIKLRTSAPKWAVPVPILGSEAGLRMGQSVLLAGFGRTNEFVSAMSTLLQSTHVDIVSVEDRKITVDQSKGTGACWGDSGGPAFLETDRGLVVIGATSGSAYGSVDCHTKVVYASLPGFKEFLQKVATVLGGEPPVFVE
ncbi:S1 family peptidase [Bdellovibrio sp. HCB288]|uniref:S1 family peptidase n=1 Tax=Bdellovibrio sp. HCB288 TaxID=3394355 RepID=UPI0039B5630C